MLDRLPYEIFRDIIKQSSDKFMPLASSTPLDPIATQIPLPPITATHVCRSWRKALLSDPALWTLLIIPYMEPDEIEAMIQRSCSASLDVLIGPPGVHTPVITVVFQELHRIGTLEMHFCQEYDLSGRERLLHVMSYLKHPAPRLERLDLKLMSGEPDLQEQYFQDLFSGDAPNLKHLSRYVLKSFRELLSFPLCRNLSSLYLELPAMTAFHHDALLNALQLSPCLRILGIEAILPQLAVFPRASDYQVHLPHLQQLILRGKYIVDVANFVLRRLKFPIMEISYYIKGNDLHDRRSDTAPILHFLAQRPCTSLAMSAYSDETALGFYETYTRNPGESVFETRHRPASGPTADLPSFLRMFKLSSITYLFLTELPLDFSTLKSIFHSLVNLQYLVIKHNNEGDRTVDPLAWMSFLFALTDQESSQHDNSRKHTFPCPSLHWLEIVFMDRSVHLNEQYARMLVRCSENRLQAGHPFRCIVIPQDDLTKEVRDILETNEDFPVEVWS